MREVSSVAAWPSRPTRRSRLTVAMILVSAAALVPSWTPTAFAQASPSPAVIESAAPAESLPPPPSDAPSTGTTWEYRTLFVRWDNAKLDWVADFSDGTRVDGLDAILNAEGSRGWELVAVVPELWQQVIDGAVKEDARRLRLFLKKPVG